jgi:hypothetical protein
MRELGRCLAPLVLLATPAVAEGFDPASLDLAALIECRADMPAYNGFALWLAGEPGAVGKLGWKEVAAGNPFLVQYELPTKIRVFGRETTSIAFSATGPMAVLDGVAAPDLARELDVSRRQSRHRTNSLARRSLSKAQRTLAASASPRASRSTSRPSSHTPARRWPAAPTRST